MFSWDRSESGDGESSVMARVLSTFLNELDGISSLGSNNNVNGAGGKGKKDFESESEFNVFVLAASESLTNLDQALLRPGRLSHHVMLGLPTKQDIGDLLRFFSKKLPLSDDVCLDEIVRLCTERLRDGRSGAEGPTCAAVSALCREAVQLAVRERIHISPSFSSSSSCEEEVSSPSETSTPALDLSRYTVNDTSNGCVTQAHFLRALELFLPTPCEKEGNPDSFSVPDSSSFSKLPPFEFYFDSGGDNKSILPSATPVGPASSEFKFNGEFNVGTSTSSNLSSEE